MFWNIFDYLVKAKSFIGSGVKEGFRSASAEAGAIE